MTESPVAELLAELVRCDSTNPDLVAGGAGEAGVAAIVARRLAAAGFDVSVEDVAEGRPNVRGRLAGRGGGRKMQQGSHNQVVGIVAGVTDEELGSLGAVALAEQVAADAAILPEQSDLQLITAHGGFAWFELTSVGFEAAGIDVERGVDSIALLAPVLERISSLDRELAAREPAAYGRPAIHASTIAGGSQYPAFPARTVLGIERCTVGGESTADAIAEIEAMIAAAERADPRFEGHLELVGGRDPVELDRSEPIVRILDEVAGERLGAPAVHRGDIGWMDSGILVEAGIPCVIFGPTGAGEHTDDEWGDLESLDVCAEILELTARRFCEMGS